MSVVALSDLPAASGEVVRMVQAIVRSIVAGLVPVMLGGCGAYDSIKESVEGEKDSDEVSASPTPEGTPEGWTPTPVPTSIVAPTAAPSEPTPLPEPPDPPSNEVVPEDFRGVTWLHSDVSSWPETSRLNVSIGDGMIRLDYDKTRVWPDVNGVNANPWIFIFRDGHWWAATFEWLRFGQTTKPIHTIAGDHIKRQPFGDFTPRSGEIYGFMVSGLARDATRNVKERTNVVMKRWP